MGQRYKISDIGGRCLRVTLVYGAVVQNKEHWRPLSERTLVYGAVVQNKGHWRPLSENNTSLWGICFTHFIVMFEF